VALTGMIKCADLLEPCFLACLVSDNNMLDGILLDSCFFLIFAISFLHVYVPFKLIMGAKWVYTS